ncbi:hypothetical protein YQE_05975, partial [Dendroctonus ponderosae]
MGLQRNLVLVVSCAFLLSVCAAEFVPVYIWGTRSAGEPVPALHKISQSSFKDEVANKLRANSRIIVFAEHSLSPEDFGQRDRSGDLAFPNLSKLRKTSKVTYLSYVQNPVKAIQLASDDVAEISIERLRENFEIPDSKIVIIDLNDADENERRFDMLKRHVSNQSDVITLTGVNGTTFQVIFQFTKSGNSYWYLQDIHLTVNNTSFNQTTNGTIYAPLGFSYACGNQVFKSTNLAVTFPQFQVQPTSYRSTPRTRSSKFDDPYNCVGFTTIPIWSGLFVTFILLLIMTFGITMMMDIKTMDRFDDAKGKTITINTSE